MNNLPHDASLYSLMTIIVNRSQGQRVIQYAQRLGLKRFTSFHGRGTVPNALLKFLEMSDVSKEVLLFVLPTVRVEEITTQITEKFQLEKPGKGILFTVKLSHVLGITHKAPSQEVEQPVGPASVLGICTIVEKGQAEDVFQAAKEAAAHGGTIIEAHGSTEQSLRLFNMRVETEKEMVLILVPASDAPVLSEAIRQKLDLDKSNTGILFTFAVDHTVGLKPLPKQPFNAETNGSTSLDSTDGPAYDAIFAIVPAGKDDLVIRSAEQGGSQGGTILHARGAHIREHAGIIASIEPTREVVVVISRREDTAAISESIHEKMHLDAPGQGILFVFPLQEVHGIRP